MSSNTDNIKTKENTVILPSPNNQIIIDDIITFLEVPMGSATQFGTITQKRIIVQSQLMLIQHSSDGTYQLGKLDIVNFEQDSVNFTTINILKTLLSKVLATRVPVVVWDAHLYLSVISSNEKVTHDLKGDNWLKNIYSQGFKGYPDLVYTRHLSLHDSDIDTRVAIPQGELFWKEKQRLLIIDNNTIKQRGIDIETIKYR